MNGGARAPHAVAALVGSATLVAWDLATVLTTPPSWRPSPFGLAAFAIGAWGLGAVLGAGMLLVRGELRGVLARVPAGLAVAGAADGAALWYLAVVRHNPAPVGPGLRVALLAGALALGAALGLLRARLGRVLAVVSLLFAAASLPMLLHRGDTYLRLTLQAVSFASLATLLEGHVRRTAPAFVGLAAAAVACAALSPVASRSETAREALQARAEQSQTWAYAIHRVADRDDDGASSVFGGTDCDPAHGSVFPGAHERPDDGRDENCEGGDGHPAARPAPSAARGVARGADVLLLSFDSLRWDLSGALGGVRAAMGDALEMTRAVCPSPKTVTSLGSALRGRPFREVRFEDVWGVRGKIPTDPSPTIAVPLARAGYRVVFVPTHPYVDRPTRVAAGFERIGPRTWPLRPFVPAPDAVRALRGVFASTKGPVCAFAHFMESHHPYRYGDREGPNDRSGLASSLRWVDRVVAPLVRELGRRRGRRLVVAAFGDHGEEFGEHGGTLHASSAYAEQSRVALLFSGPGIPPGRIDAPVSIASIPATILDLVGAEVPASMTEPSLLPLLRGEAPTTPLAVTEVRTTRVAVGYTSDRFRLVVDPVHRLESLFDSEADPLEQRDLARSHPGALARMRRLARQWDEAH